MSTERPDHEATDPAEDGAGTAKSRRRRSPVAVVSVAAAVLLVGGGGAYMATAAFDGGGHGGSESPGGDGTPPPLTLDGATGGGGTGGVAPGEPNPYGTVYRADGKLPDGPDSAPVYAARGTVTAAEVTRLAKALGLTGTPRLVGDTWQAGQAGDGSGPSLQVNRRAPGTWTFSRYAPGTDNCKGVVCTSDPGSPSSHAVSEAAAKKAAAPVLKALGEDDAKLDASTLMGAVRVVNADPEVGGLPTSGWTTGVQVGEEGQVVGGNGLLKAPERGDTYPVLGARRTLDLMNAPGSAPGGARNGPGGCASAVPLKDRDESPCAASTVLPRRESVNVEKAAFGLASHFVDGHQTLVPSWLFEVRPKGATALVTVTHPAVDPKYLAAPETPGAPALTPSPRPTGEPASRDVTVQGYTADGRDLTVSFTGGVCADYSVSASGSADKVTVKVTETPWQGKICILIARVYEKTVRLDEPLGDRKVVGSDGGEIREGKTPGASTSMPVHPTEPTTPRVPKVPHTQEPLVR
ncbi:hypothetical protein ABZV34_32630 [Streptomyces sp. NPDC005195]|uniref:hypothetical protein n=1 Tax=Streptomyces sp. NPDC005195 TaxID=3154561 RepID=UPI0033AD32E3